MPRLGLHGRVVLAILWTAGQSALVLTAPLRADHIFGFRMFPEASTMLVHLTREANGRWSPAPRGEWQAQDPAGRARWFSWRDRVRDPTLAAVDTRVFASYGVDAQLARLQRALDDVAAHVPDDAQTSRLGAEVTVWKNGREPKLVTLSSRPRLAR